MKTIQIREKSWNFLWDVKRNKKLRNMDDVISLLKEIYDRVERRLIKNKK